MKTLPRHDIYRNLRPLTLTDHLALDQFLLAMERNLLLHITTGLNMIVVGVAMFRFFSRHESDLYMAIGLIAFLIAALVISKGVRDFLVMRRAFAEIVDSPSGDS